MIATFSGVRATCASRSRVSGWTGYGSCENRGEFWMGMVRRYQEHPAGADFPSIHRGECHMVKRIVVLVVLGFIAVVGAPVAALALGVGLGTAVTPVTSAVPVPGAVDSVVS